MSPGDDGAAGEQDQDDPKLRAMRAVWLTMREEDPPARGLAELMAAARVKAEALQPRPMLWQRLVAGLWRPPVLALATMVVLLGGALVLGRHADRAELRIESARSAGPAMGSALQATPSTSEAPGAVAPMAGGSPSSVARVREPTAAPEDRRPAASVSSRRSSGEVTAGAEAAASTREDGAPTEASGKPGSAAGSLASGRGTASAIKDLGPPRPQPRALDAVAAHDDAPKRQPGGGAATAPRRAGEALDLDARTSPHDAPAPAEPALPQSGGPGAGQRRLAAAGAPASSADEAGKRDGRTDATATANAVPAPSTRQGGQGRASAQLYKQCESAARRGDCIAVKKIAGRITTTDRDYRARLAKDSAIAKCLAD